MLPNFLCVGAQKAGTTTLYDILKQHPEIYMPKDKELHFFNIEESYSKGIEWYERSFFKDTEKKNVIGEVTPVYMFLEHIPGRILNDLGKDIKLIFILRNPVDRAYSHYGMTVANGLETESFEKALELEEKRLVELPSSMYKHSYMARGYYAKQIKNYLKYFSIENMLFIIFEEFIKDEEAATKQIFDFLGVNSKLNLNYKIHSNKAWKQKDNFIRYFFTGRVGRLAKAFLKKILDNNLRKELIKLQINILRKFASEPISILPLDLELRSELLKKYENDIKELEKIIKKDLSLWKG